MMIVWLASYPRSGNTFVRMTIKEAYGLDSFSVHEDSSFEDLGIVDVVGHRDMQDVSLDELEKDSSVYFVKTHFLPGQDEYPCIYIVRDGRDALVSYAHFRSELDGLDAPLSEILKDLVYGESPFGSWGEHIQAWTARNGKTIILKYDAMKADPFTILDRAIKELGLPLTKLADRKKSLDFGNLHLRAPAFFRSGNNDQWKSEMPLDLQKVFWRKNGSAMIQLSYGKTSGSVVDNPMHLPSVNLEEYGVEIREWDAVMEGIYMPPYHGPKDLVDFQFMMGLASAKQPKSIFEFGTAFGNTVANLCKATDAKVYTLNAEPSETSGVLRTVDLSKDEIGSAYRNAGFADRVTQILCNSLDLDVECYFRETQLDFVVIDACHDFEYVLNDFLSILPKLSDNGCVLFHGCHPSLIGDLNGPWVACYSLRQAGFDIRHVPGTWWAIWDKKWQVDALNDDILCILKEIVEQTHERRDMELKTRARIECLDDEISAVRKSLSWKLTYPLRWAKDHLLKSGEKS
jgi:cephalosporin hydroxylase